MSGAVVVVGTVGAPFGVKGWVHVRSFTEPAENLVTYRPWHLDSDDAWHPVSASVRPHGDAFVARIDDTSDRNAASVLRGRRIGVAATQLPPPQAGEHYWRDLVGRRVVREMPQGVPEQSLGAVTRVFATPAHDVLVVADGKRETLIPFVRQIVVDVDEHGGCLVVDWDPTWQ